MNNRMCEVTVKEFPPTLSAKQQRVFFRELVGDMDDRPCLVFDCSRVRELDKSMLYLLLCCLEEALKRNGDVRLAALPHSAGTMLVRAGLDHLFDVLDTTAEAVNSFSRPSACGISPIHVQVTTRKGIEGCVLRGLGESS